MLKVYLGLGSNLGEREKYIHSAIGLLREIKAIKVNRVSKLYETEPQGGDNLKGKFLNGAMEIETSLSPRALLRLLKEVELKLGRKPKGVRWSARPIDLDILLYGNLILNEPDLTIPHPLMHERQFVLQPLVEIAKQVKHPNLNETIEELYLALLQK